MIDDISHEGLRVLLREEGVSFQHVKTWEPSRDPDYAAKKARVEHLYAIADGEVIPEDGELEDDEQRLRRGCSRTCCYPRMKSVGSPEVFAGIGQLLKAVQAGGVDPRLLSVIHLRVTQITSCAPCAYSGDMFNRINHTAREQAGKAW
ncbi:hypothetical protein PUR71_04150 [Streptomyces sp. SP17BM10]|nr:hypothetical protein [Streptomyces sp. SP17BM10]